MIKEPVNVLSATHSGEYRVHLVFDDSTEQEVDFEPFLTHSAHPEIRAYLDRTRFRTFRVDYGDLVWGDYELCFPVMDLYRNQIDHVHSLEAAA